VDAGDIGDQIDTRSALAGLGYPETSEPQRITGGWDTLLWRFETPDGRQHSLRIYILPDREQSSRREEIALRACESHDLPAPRVEAVGRSQDMPAAVLSWCPGRPVLSLVEKQPWAVLRLSRLFGRAQAQIHAVPAPPELAAGAPGDWLSRAGPDYRLLADHMAALGPATDAFIHMDYHPLNLISDGKEVTGIIDWGGAAAGDRRADLARTYITLVTAPVPPGPMSLILNFMRNAMLWAWRRGYEELAGPMPDFRLYRAWAAATLLTELEVVIDRPGVWGTPKDAENLRRKIALWARQSGQPLAAAVSTAR
jgi:aminoglycoside phosphotransferase (APT) family kinase protein